MYMYIYIYIYIYTHTSRVKVKSSCLQQFNTFIITFIITFCLRNSLEFQISNFLTIHVRAH